MPKLNQLFDSELEIAACGLIIIGILEIIALIKGIDGSIYGLSMAAIGVIVGYVFKRYNTRKKNP
jgi:hypothetical protein